MVTELSNPMVMEPTLRIVFSGDHVKLAGQVDYPDTLPPTAGYPLIFILQHACCTGLQGHEHYAQLGNACGYAVFRWDKRGTGSSGSGGIGSPIQDALKAYQTAVTQSFVDASQVYILAQNEGTLLLAEQIDAFQQINPIQGAILAGNMIDEQEIIALDFPLHIVHGENDWFPAATYAQRASISHENAHGYGTDYYIADKASRRLKNIQTHQYHNGAWRSIKNWLESQ